MVSEAVDTGQSFTKEKYIEQLFGGGVPQMVLAAGISIMGYHYSRDVIEEALSSGAIPRNGSVAAFENHRANDAEGREVQSYLGSFTNPRYRTVQTKSGEQREGLVANLTLADTAYNRNTIAPKLAHSRFTAGEADELGPSVRVHGHFRPGQYQGKDINIFDKITELEHIDLVVQPSAGAATVSVEESAKMVVKDTPEVEPVATPAAPVAPPKEPESEAVVEESAIQAKIDKTVDDRMKKYREERVVEEQVRSVLAEVDVDSDDIVGIVMASDNPVEAAGKMRETIVADRDRKDTKVVQEQTTPDAPSENMVKTRIGMIPMSRAKLLGLEY